MAAELHRTTARLKGPWLLRRNHLLDLDATLATGFEAPNVTSEPGARSNVTTEIRRKLDVFLDGQKTLPVKSFEEAIRTYPSLERGLARGFKYEVSDGNVTATVWLEDNEREASDAPTPDSDHKLFIRVAPHTDPSAQVLFFALHDWAIRAQLRIAERTFERYAGWLVLLALVSWAHLTPDTPKSSAYYKEQARALLATHSPMDQAAAVRLLLAIAADAPVPGGQSIVAVPRDARYYAWLLVAVFSVLATAYVKFSPSTLLGIGQGEDRIALWNRVRSVFYAAPVFVLTTVVFPDIFKRLGF